MLAIAEFYDYEIWQMDVKTPVIHLWMDILKKSCIWCNQKVFVDPKGADKVCKLQRSIYGLVQASRSWNIRFDEGIKAYRFIQTYGEACIYKKWVGALQPFW